MCWLERLAITLSITVALSAPLGLVTRGASAQDGGADETAADETADEPMPSEVDGPEAATDAPTADASESGDGSSAPPLGTAMPPHEPTEAELAEARHAFEVASAAFENGDYETASSEFRTAYELSRHPSLLYDVYLAEERAGRPGEAATFLERYLETDAAGPDERTILERRLERLRTRAASRTGVTDPTESEADRAALLVAPTDAAGNTWVVAPTTTRPPTAGIALLVTGGVLLASFAVLAPLSEVEDQRLATTCGRSAGRSCAASETETLFALNLSSDIAWIGGATLGVVGLVLLFALPPERDVIATPTVGPTHAGLIVGGRF